MAMESDARDYTEWALESLRQMDQPLQDAPARILATMEAMHERLQALEQGSKGLAETRSGSSSAATLGRARRRWPLPSASPVFRQELSALTEQISAFCKSTWSIEPVLEAMWPDSLTLQLTLRWPTTSTETPATPGSPGLADQTEGERCEHVWFPVSSVTAEGWNKERHGWLFEVCKRDCGAIRQSISGTKVVMVPEGLHSDDGNPKAAPTAQDDTAMIQADSIHDYAAVPKRSFVMQPEDLMRTIGGPDSRPEVRWGHPPAVPDKALETEGERLAGEDEWDAQCPKSACGLLRLFHSLTEWRSHVADATTPTTVLDGNQESLSDATEGSGDDPNTPESVEGRLAKWSKAPAAGIGLTALVIEHRHWPLPTWAVDLILNAIESEAAACDHEWVGLTAATTVRFFTVMVGESSLPEAWCRCCGAIRLADEVTTPTQSRKA